MNKKDEADSSKTVENENMGITSTVKSKKLNKLSCSFQSRNNSLFTAIENALPMPLPALLLLCCSYFRNVSTTYAKTLEQIPIIW